MTLYNRVGELIFGTRLKRLSDRFLADVAQLYRTMDIAFEPSWFPLFWLLDEAGALSVTEMAKELEITHSAVSQMVTQLDKRSLLCFMADASDRRRRLVCLTKGGQALLEQVRPVWRAMTRAMRDLLEEGSHSEGLLPGLDELEIALGKQSFLDRLLGEIHKDDLGPIQIRTVAEEDADAVNDLVLLWLTENAELTLETGDTPIRWLATIDGQAVGLVTLAKGAITQLVVRPEWRHRHVGRRLVEATLTHARSQGLDKLEVTVPRRAVHALKLFRDLDFRLDAVSQGGAGQDIHLSTPLVVEDAA